MVEIVGPDAPTGALPTASTDATITTAPSKCLIFFAMRRNANRLARKSPAGPAGPVPALIREDVAGVACSIHHGSASGPPRGALGNRHLGNAGNRYLCLMARRRVSDRPPCAQVLHKGSPYDVRGRRLADCRCGRRARRNRLGTDSTALNSRRLRLDDEPARA